MTNDIFFIVVLGIFFIGILGWVYMNNCNRSFCVKREAASSPAMSSETFFIVLLGIFLIGAVWIYLCNFCAKKDVKNISWKADGENLILSNFANLQPSYTSGPVRIKGLIFENDSNNDFSYNKSEGVIYYNGRTSNVDMFLTINATVPIPDSVFDFDMTINNVPLLSFNGINPGINLTTTHNDSAHYYCGKLSTQLKCGDVIAFQVNPKALNATSNSVFTMNSLVLSTTPSGC